MSCKISGLVVLVGLVGLCAGQAAAQDQATSIVKYVTAKRGTAWNRPVMLVVVAPRQGAGQAELVVPNKNPMGDKFDPDPMIAEKVKTLKPGDLIQVVTSTLEEKVVINSLTTYTAKPGEDDPSTYVFVKLVEGKSGAVDTLAVVVKKGDKSATLNVPNKKTADGKLAPDEELAAAARELKEDDIVEVRAQGNILRYIGPYKAPEKGEFAAAVEQKVGEVNYLAVQLKQADQTVSVLVPARKNESGALVRDVDILAKVKALKPGQLVEYKTRQENGQTVLLDIRPSTDKPPASKPADKPKAPAGG